MTGEAGSEPAALETPVARPEDCEELFDVNDQHECSAHQRRCKLGLCREYQRQLMTKE